MKKNPLDIEPGTFFLCGHDKTVDNSDNGQFAEVEKMLTDKGHKVLNPFGLEKKNRFACLAMCDRVVTLANWDMFENSVKEVGLARHIGITDIILADGFERWEKAKGVQNAK